MKIVQEHTVLTKLQKLASEFKTQGEFADSMETSQQYTSEILRGRKPIPAKWAAAVGYEKHWVKVK